MILEEDWKIVKLPPSTTNNVLIGGGTLTFVLLLLICLFFVRCVSRRALDVLATERLSYLLFLLSMIRLFFVLVPVDGCTDATELKNASCGDILGLHRLWCAVFVHTLILYLYFSAVTTYPLSISFSFTDRPPGSLYYCYTSHFGRTTRFRFFAKASLHDHSAPRCSGFACVLSFSFSFWFVFDSVFKLQWSRLANTSMFRSDFQL